MYPAAEAGEMVLWVLALPVTGEAIPGGGWCSAAPRPFVSGIGPEPGGPGLADAGSEHADGRVIRKDRLSRQDMTTDGIGQRLQQCSGFADPVGQGGAVEVETFSVEDLVLPV
jgi:hypothetical protein